jgi:hypothetical protein
VALFTSPRAKAWAAAVVSALLAFLSSVATALGGGETGFGSITPYQWLVSVIAAVIAFASAGGITFATPNAAGGIRQDAPR